MILTVAKFLPIQSRKSHTVDVLFVITSYRRFLVHEIMTNDDIEISQYVYILKVSIYNVDYPWLMGPIYTYRMQLKEIYLCHFDSTLYASQDIYGDFIYDMTNSLTIDILK